MTIRRKLLFKGVAVTPNYVFVVIQSETTKNDCNTNQSDMLKGHKSPKELGNPGKVVIYVAYMSDCTKLISFLVVKDIILKIHPQVTISRRCLCLVIASIRTRSDGGEHGNKSCDSEYYVFYFKQTGFT